MNADAEQAEIDPVAYERQVARVEHLLVVLDGARQEANRILTRAGRFAQFGFESGRAVFEYFSQNVQWERRLPPFGS